MINKSSKEFIDILASAAPVPGGGGASALVGAIGMALGSMVANLTLGKKKYADVQDQIKAALEKATKIQDEMLDLIRQDAVVFEPLSKAYGLPKSDEKDKVMEAALKEACAVPMTICETAMKVIELQEELAEIGTAIAISDVGVGVLFAKAALMGGALNVTINTELMKDKAYAKSQDDKVEKLLEEGTKRADAVYLKVVKRIKG